MRTARLTTIATLVSALLAFPAAIAAPAHAYGTIGCQDRVDAYQLPTAPPRRVYVVSGQTVLTTHNVWIYLETNHKPGLQRHDAECEHPDETHDMVVGSTRILCTCDYPFGYFPDSWIDARYRPVKEWSEDYSAEVWFWLLGLLPA